MRRTVTLLLLLAYAAAVIVVTILPIQPHPDSYWAGIPWWTMIHWIPFVVDGASMVLNVIMFVPFGVLVPLVRPGADSVRRILWSSLAASSVIEIVQLILGLTLGSRRTVDVNDLIANSAGALTGLLLLRLAVPEAAHRAALTRIGEGTRRSR